MLSLAVVLLPITITNNNNKHKNNNNNNNNFVLLPTSNSAARAFSGSPCSLPLPHRRVKAQAVSGRRHTAAKRRSLAEKSDCRGDTPETNATFTDNNNNMATAGRGSGLRSSVGRGPVQTAGLGPSWKRVMELIFSPAKGRPREAFLSQKAGAGGHLPRDMGEPMMATHAAFLPL
ncbi:unnamed protein product, partial [Polarella glacialis]